MQSELSACEQEQF